jgi:hypothetical protein
MCFRDFVQLKDDLAFDNDRKYDISSAPLDWRFIWIYPANTLDTRDFYSIRQPLISSFNAWQHLSINLWHPLFYEDSFFFFHTRKSAMSMHSVASRGFSGFSGRHDGSFKTPDLAVWFVSVAGEL